MRNTPPQEVILVDISFYCKNVHDCAKTTKAVKLYLSRAEDIEMFRILTPKGKWLIWQMENYLYGQQRDGRWGLNNTSKVWRSDSCITFNNLISQSHPITQPAKWGTALSLRQFINSGFGTTLEGKKRSPFPHCMCKHQLIPIMQKKKKTPFFCLRTEIHDVSSVIRLFTIHSSGSQNIPTTEAGNI